SRAAQAVELDLSPWKGAVPIELAGRSAFPPIGDLPYLVTLPAYGFYWFLLADEAQAPSWHQPMPAIVPEFVTLTTTGGHLASITTGREKRQLEQDVLPAFLPLQRWFGAKDRKIGKVEISPLGELDRGRHLLAKVSATVGEDVQEYFLPLSARWGEDNLAFGAPKLSYTLAKLRHGPRVGALIDGAYDEQFSRRLLEALRAGEAIETEGGRIVFDGASGIA